MIAASEERDDRAGTTARHSRYEADQKTIRGIVFPTIEWL